MVCYVLFIYFWRLFCQFLYKKKQSYVELLCTYAVCLLHFCINMNTILHFYVNMLYNTWLIHCSVALTNNILDSNEKPAVLSAIMKQQTTDRAREVLNEGMDINAGSAICLGNNNFLEKFYKAAPIGITVEGSNTLTKNLIIFGQGLNKSHPYIYPILDSILTNNEIKFETYIKLIIKHSLSL